MILVFGGTFNPPTKAHFEIVEKLIQSFDVKKVLIVPVSDNYPWKKDLTSFKDRFTMLQLMFKNNQKVEVSDLENTNAYLGTYALLKTLNRIHPHVYFVLGTDHLKSLHLWKNSKNLLNEFGFIVINRKNYEPNFKLFEKHQTKYLTINYESDISSTQIRKNVTQHQNDLIPEVYAYIIQNKLYQGESS